MIGDYFTKALQGSQYCPSHNISRGIHEDGINSYNVSARALLEELEMKIDKEKEEAHKATKLKGN